MNIKYFFTLDHNCIKGSVEIDNIGSSAANDIATSILSKLTHKDKEILGRVVINKGIKDNLILNGISNEHLKPLMLEVVNILSTKSYGFLKKSY